MKIIKRIIDIKKTYGFNIGIIDFFTLVFYVCLSLNKSKLVEKNQILKLNGLLEI